MVRLFRGMTVSGVAVFGMATSSFAADLPSRQMAPPPPPPLFYNWSGFYVGLNAGVGWNNAGNVTVQDPNLGSRSIGVSAHSGFVGGGQIGWNFQYGSFVGGFETDIQYAGIKESVNWGPYGFLGVSSGGSGGYFGTVRARAGYAIDRTLLYLTGGLAYGGLNASPFGGNTSNTGYALGGGVEYAFDQHWTTRLEALYVNLSNGESKTVAVTGPLQTVYYPLHASNGNGGGVVRIGLNYKF